MKTLKSICLVAMILTAAIVKLQVKEFPQFTGPYVGQTPPINERAVFAPGIVSTAPHEYSSCFSPDGKEFYFTRIHPILNQRVVIFSKLINGAWTEPAVNFFSGQDTFEPFVTPDNQRLYFQSGRIVAGALQIFTLYVESNGTG